MRRFRGETTKEQVLAFIAEHSIQSKAELERANSKLFYRAKTRCWFPEITFQKSGKDILWEPTRRRTLEAINTRTDIRLHEETFVENTKKAKFSCLTDPSHPDWWAMPTKMVKPKNKNRQKPQGCPVCGGSQPLTKEWVNQKLSPKGLYLVGDIPSGDKKASGLPATIGCLKCGGQYKVAQVRIAYKTTHQCPLCPDEEATAKRQAKKTLKLARQAVNASPLRKRRKRLVRWHRVAREIIASNRPIKAIDLDFYVGRDDTRMRFQCLKDPSHIWETIYHSVIGKAQSGCRKCCVGGGFHSDKPSKLYLMRVLKNGQLFGIKVGITGQKAHPERLWTLSYKNHHLGFEFEVLYEKNGSGDDIWGEEKHIKQNFKRIPLTKEQMIDGRTEIYEVSEFDAICKYLNIDLNLQDPPIQVAKVWWKTTSPKEILQSQVNEKIATLLG